VSLRLTKVCRYNWHSAGSLGWPFPMLKYKYIFQIKYTEAILSKSTRKLLWFDYKNADCSLKKQIYCVIYDNFRHTFVHYANTGRIHYPRGVGHMSPIKCPFPLRDPSLHLTCGSLGPDESAANWHLDRLSRFGRAHNLAKTAYSHCNRTRPNRLDKTVFVASRRRCEFDSRTPNVFRLAPTVANSVHTTARRDCFLASGRAV